MKVLLLYTFLFMLASCQQRTITLTLPPVPYAESEPGDDD